MRVFRILAFLAFYLRALLAANFRIAVDVLTPGLKMRPGFIAVPLQTRNNTELLAVANLVTMTPGTLSVDISPDGKTLFVHAVYLDEVEKVRNQIENVLQRRVLEVLR